MVLLFAGKEHDIVERTMRERNVSVLLISG